MIGKYFAINKHSTDKRQNNLYADDGRNDANKKFFIGKRIYACTCNNTRTWVYHSSKSKRPTGYTNNHDNNSSNTKNYCHRIRTICAQWNTYISMNTDIAHCHKKYDEIFLRCIQFMKNYLSQSIITKRTKQT